MIWRKFIFWLLEHTLKAALELNRHIKVRDDKVYFDCPDDLDEPDVVFDIGAFYDAYLEEAD